MTVGRVLLGVQYIGAGFAHWAFRKMFTAIVPDYLPAHEQLVLISGAAALAGGVGVLLPTTRRAAAWGLVIWLIAVYPANIWMVQHPERYRFIPPWMLWARLPFQFPMMWWAWKYTRPQRTLEGRA